MPPKSRKKTLDAYIETTPIQVAPPSPPSLEPASAPTLPTPPPPKKARTRSSVKKDEKPPEHVIVQLPISAEKIHEIIETEAFVESNPSQSQNTHIEPLPYISTDHFTHLQDTVSDTGGCMESKQAEHAMKDMHPSLSIRRACFWCCHEIGAHKYGMPIMYDSVHQVFQQFGAFCSLECAAAHNFATHLGSDKVWEIHSWIQLLAKKLGIETPIRPAPSRFLLQMFGGPMQIDDFRMCHKSLHRAYVMNIPPMINVSSQTEIMNISYIYDRPGDSNDDQRNKLSRKKALMDSKRTLDAKMNLSYETMA
jgi:hypothetical protein